MLAWSFSQGTGTFTAIAGLTINPNESVIAAATKVVVLQGSTQVTASVCDNYITSMVTNS